MFQAKFDYNRKTGVSEKKLTEVDNAVLDIVDKQSPVAVGLPVPESGARWMPLEDPEPAAVPGPSPSPVPFPAKKRRRSGSAGNGINGCARDDYYRALEHKVKLDILKLEKEMMLPLNYSKNNGICDFYDIE